MKAYGSGAYAGIQPIGGGPNYVSKYLAKDARYIPENASDLTLALSSALSGQLIWLPKRIPISGPYGKWVNPGVILGSNHVVGGGILSDYNPKGYMIPLLRSALDSIISGLTLEGVTGFGPPTSAGPCGIRGDGTKHGEVEDCDISKLSGAGVWFGDTSPGITVWNDDAQRNRVHHCHIHHIQRHGFGYGIGEQGGGQSFLADCNYIHDCRHLIMGQAGSDSYELRYNIFGDSLYGYNGDPNNLYHNQQVDCHGNDNGSASPSAGNHILIHWNEFSDNMGTTSHGNTQNVRIRGVPEGLCEVIFNVTKKTTHSGVYTETIPGNGIFEQTITMATFQKMIVGPNWYGLAQPPDLPQDMVRILGTTRVIGLRLT